MPKGYPLDELSSMYEWIQQKTKDARGLTHSAEKLLNSAIQEAMGEKDVAGNPEQLVYVARRIAKVRKAFLEWGIEFNLTEVKPECERLFVLMSDSAKDCIEKIEGFPSRVNSEIDKSVEAYKRGEQYVANLKLTFEMTNGPEIQAEFARLENLVGH
jgi:hypothetical protein